MTPSSTPDATLPALVLFVDDDPDTREVCQISLTLEGFRVEEADSGLVAITKAKELLPDAIVIDLALPGVDGLAVCREIKRDERTARIPVIAYTGWSSESHRAEAKAAGFNDFLLKPVPLDVLVAHVRQAIAVGRRGITESRALIARVQDQLHGRESDSDSPSEPLPPGASTATGAPRSAVALRLRCAGWPREMVERAVREAALVDPALPALVSGYLADPTLSLTAIAEPPRLSPAQIADIWGRLIRSRH